MAKKSKKQGSAPEPATRLALDRYLLGIWGERELREFVRSEPVAGSALAGLAEINSLERDREAERLRAELLGAARPGGQEELEALVREGVDFVERGRSLLPELQHDLLAHVDAVTRDDPRAEAVRILAELARAAQVNLAVQGIGRLAEATTDRVEKARAAAIERLRSVLASHPHLAPR